MSWDSPSEYAGFDNQSPSPQDVEAFHRNSDKDKSAYAQHHTLGKGPNQAAPGNHEHRDIRIAGFINANQAIPHATWTRVTNFSGVHIDEENLTYGPAGLWTVAKAGWYTTYLNVMWSISGAAANLALLAVLIDGERKNTSRIQFPDGNFFSLQVSYEGYIEAGQTIEFHAYTSNSLVAAHELNSGEISTHYFIRRTGS